MLFIFRREDECRETIHVGDVAIAKTNGYPEEFEWLASPPAGVTAEHVYEAAVKADGAGFWRQDEELPGTRWGYIINMVSVTVPVPETTSTILSLTTEDER